MTEPKSQRNPSHPHRPQPAHQHVDSMLSRKFGREIANYYSGSPLNRVSFLRENHGFIADAFKHSSTKFLLLNNLSPMAKDPANLAYATHGEIKGLTGENPFTKTEAELIKEYNSSITLPQILFLGLDERVKEGFKHEMYAGNPYFAVDITPKGTVKEEAEKLIEAQKAKGNIFLEGRFAMSLNAPEGMSALHHTILWAPTNSPT
jgi:NAD+ diphosphatase